MRRAAAAALSLTLLLPGCGGPGGKDVLGGESVRFTTDDGVELAGEVRGTGEVGVILLHMFPADRTSWASFAQQLADEGYAALTFDFRGYGESEGNRRIDQIWRDVLAAVRFMRNRGHDRVVLIGASMGGTAALVVAAREDVAGVVTLSAASTFMGLDIPPEALALITAPKLFIAAQGDATAAATAQQLYAASPAPKRVDIVNGNEHGTELLEGGQAELVRTTILQFLRTQV